MKRKLKDALEVELVRREGSGKKGDAYRWHPVDRGEPKERS